MKVTSIFSNASHKMLVVCGLLIMAGIYPRVIRATEEDAVVRAVLFYSPSCGHCHYVIEEVLPPLIEQYGESFQIVGVNVTTTEGNTLFSSAVERFGLPSYGVPALIIADKYLVGSADIPEQLPGLIERYLAEGGIDWPDIPGLAEALAQSESTPEPTEEAVDQAEGTLSATVVAAANSSDDDAGLAVSGDSLLSATDEDSNDILAKIKRDPEGNAVAIALLVVMVLVVLAVIAQMSNAWNANRSLTFSDSLWTGWRFYGLFVLCIIGMGVSIYLAHVETSGATAVCGPIGDCNTVQQSEYATLFGVIPIGVMGIGGYVALLVAWAGIRWMPQPRRRFAALALFGMSLFGTLFSIYLTFLEPFVIGASCAWCLTSATTMTLILMMVAGTLVTNPTSEVGKPKPA